MEQENVSRLERQAGLLLSTQSSYGAAIGGKLRLVVEFPTQHPVTIALAGITGAPPLKPRRRARAHPRATKKIVSTAG